MAKNLRRAGALLLALALLALAMCLGMLGITAMAEGAGEHNAVPCQTCGGDHTVEVDVACPTCKGEQDVPMVNCEDCGGTGTVYEVDWAASCPNNGNGCSGCDDCYFGFGLKEATCETCGGAGKVIDPSAEVCETCGGTGTVQQTEDCPDCTDGTAACTGEFVGQVTTAPTCVAQGVMTYTCAACQASYTETIPVDGTAHQWSEAVAAEGKEPTCGADGVGTRTCELCGGTEEVVMPATGNHSYSEETLTCTVCGAPQPADETTAAAIALMEALPVAGDVTAADQEAIQAARAAYDALTDFQKRFVTETVLDRLTQAESALSAALVAQADALLAAVPADAADDVWTTLSAWRAVGALTQEEKAQLTNTGKLAAVEAYMAGKEVFFYSASGTEFMICAPAGKLEQSNARFRAVTGSMDLEWIAGKLPAGCVVDAAYDMLDYYNIVNTVKALSDGQEVVMAFRSEVTQSLSKSTVYFVEGRFPDHKVSNAMPVQLQNGSLVITMTAANGTDASRLPYVAFARTMEYTDGSYTTPDTAANSYVPAAHAASSDGITYGYKVENGTRVVTVTIPADYTGDTVNVNMAAIREVFGELSIGLEENGQTVAGGYENSEAMTGKSHMVPGQTLPYRIEIINLSDQEYAYQSGSLWVDAAVMDNYSGYTAATGTYPTFDGSEQVFVVYRTWNKALSALLDSSSDVLDDATINAALQAIYQNEDGIEVNLPHYYLDYYNFAYNTNAKTLEELPDEAIMDLFDGYRDTAGTVAGQAVYSRETLPELNNLAYNYFYTHGLQLDQDDFWATDYATSAGAVMAGKNTGLDSKAAAAWGSLTGNAAAASALELTVTPTFLLGNSYMRYPVACDMGFTLTKVVHTTPGASTHTLTVHYVDTEGNTLLETTVTTYTTGVPYSVSIPDIEGYTYLYSEGDALSGYMNMDRVVTLVYEPGDVDIDEPDTPLDPGPGDEGGDVDIDDPDVPLDPGPGDEGGDVDIDDGDVPLDDAPQTGDSAPLLILASLLAISGGAVLTLSLAGKKRA